MLKKEENTIGLFANSVKSITFTKDSNNVASTHKIRMELLFNNLKYKTMEPQTKARWVDEKRLSFTDISDMCGFSSLSHFSRYVRTNLGAKPSDFWE